MLFKYIRIVLMKELKDIFRDKKTVISQILIPIIIFPIIAFVMGLAMSDFEKDGKEPVQIALVGENNSLYNYLSNNKDIKVVNTNDPNKALEKLDIKAIVNIDNDFDKSIQSGYKGNIKITYNQTSQKSSSAYGRLQVILQQYSANILNQRLQSKGIDTSLLEPLNIETKSVSKEDGQNIMMFSLIAPMILVIWSAVGGIASAVDLGAGEKERQTLEPLFTTKASRTSILAGKYLAVVLSSILGTIASIIGFVIATKINPNFAGEGVKMQPLFIVVAILSCIALTLVFSGIELAISFYARNFKEGQTYLAPMTFIAMVPAYFGMFLDGQSIPKYYFHIPIVNIIALMKESIVNVINVNHIMIVVGWIVLYLVVSLLFTTNMLKKESVLFRN
ncbi:ABC-type Na+ efflux pump, permease component [Gottschalkia purinilytica]|uniref:ABC-type Na+ efflux pump, permease component n=1 Tax=Gottschalkia purinilytica TaxID=1503 RepID=A0A0L0WA28_GOTPU|nr:ABC transporter permease [Gottschalkia purinilytica]KNF08292.1 ABC-type Na+ efflux pump, permease component [Gottschalkia purinilytica]